LLLYSLFILERSLAKYNIQIKIFILHWTSPTMIILVIINWIYFWCFDYIVTFYLLVSLFKKCLNYSSNFEFFLNDIFNVIIFFIKFFYVNLERIVLNILNSANYISSDCQLFIFWIYFTYNGFKNFLI